MNEVFLKTHLYDSIFMVYVYVLPLSNSVHETECCLLRERKISQM